jgi:hypothetical protein
MQSPYDHAWKLQMFSWQHNGTIVSPAENFQNLNVQRKRFLHKRCSITLVNINPQSPGHFGKVFNHCQSIYFESYNVNKFPNCL